MTSRPGKGSKTQVSTRTRLETESARTFDAPASAEGSVPQVGHLPRCVTDDLYWLGDCLELRHNDQLLHAYHSAYLVCGSERSLLVDTGHPKDWRVLERQLEDLVAAGVPEPAYIFPTHSEVPHSANLGRLLAKFPKSVACGDVRDYHLIFPDYEDRLIMMEVGDRIPLGGTEVVLVEAVFRDLVTSLWAYDTRRQALFPGDGFAYMHYHGAAECGKTAEELPELPITDFTATFLDYALYWTRFSDVTPFIARLEELVDATYPTRIVAPAHGSPILDLDATFPRIRAGFRISAERFAAIDGGED